MTHTTTFTIEINSITLWFIQLPLVLSSDHRYTANYMVRDPTFFSCYCCKNTPTHSGILKKLQKRKIDRSLGKLLHYFVGMWTSIVFAHASELYDVLANLRGLFWHFLATFGKQWRAKKMTGTILGKITTLKPFFFSNV